MVCSGQRPLITLPLAASTVTRVTLPLRASRSQHIDEPAAAMAEPGPQGLAVAAMAVGGPDGAAERNRPVAGDGGPLLRLGQAGAARVIGGSGGHSRKCHEAEQNEGEKAGNDRHADCLSGRPVNAT